MVLIIHFYFSKGMSYDAWVCGGKTGGRLIIYQIMPTISHLPRSPLSIIQQTIEFLLISY
jgi:hypothetical protein